MTDPVVTSHALQTIVQKGICAFCSGTGSGSCETPPPAQWTLAQVFDECAFPRSPCSDHVRHLRVLYRPKPSSLMLSHTLASGTRSAACA